jgi:hypothetical protein
MEIVINILLFILGVILGNLTYCGIKYISLKERGLIKDEDEF